MFARAFACYVQDRLPWRSDYLCGHAEAAVFPDVSKDGPVFIKAFPEGEERERINKCFDQVFSDCKRLGLFQAEKEDTKQETEAIAGAGIQQSRNIRRGKSR